MSKRILVDRKRLKAAIAFCSREGTPVAKANLRLLRRMWASPAGSAKRTARAAQCGRSHLFTVLKHVNSGNLAKLTRTGSFRKQRLLSDEEWQELSKKLGTEFTSVADVLAWCRRRASPAAVYAWCRELGFSFRKARRAQRMEEQINAPPPKRRELVLSAEDVELLKRRQQTERDLLRIPEGAFRVADRGEGRRIPNPVLRIEAIIRLGVATASITQVADDLKCSRTDVRRWKKVYMEKGLEALCETRPGGRPPKVNQRVPETTAHPDKPSHPFKAPQSSRELIIELIQQRLWSAWAELPGTKREEGQTLPICIGTIVLLHGLRGCGKTNLVKEFFGSTAAYFDCEDLSPIPIRCGGAFQI